ncbi:hypothetical protein [Streptomyces sp. DSM 40484]|uniref:hypothetical protein n=1 Tax=Streptomyces kroppenstedtii TaxID=3051181 RepID=UPI0028D8BA80|nr:hypothetical protein [Streptomyces sp. DSM 40484]
MNSACNSVHRAVDATVITAFATTHGIAPASSATAPLESTPTPPPHTTNRTKETNAPEAATPTVSGSAASCDFMGVFLPGEEAAAPSINWLRPGPTMPSPGRPIETVRTRIHGGASPTPDLRSAPAPRSRPVLPEYADRHPTLKKPKKLKKLKQGTSAGTQATQAPPDDTPEESHGPDP